jgi:hypothetical protein
MLDIQPEDIELLMRELNLKETTPTTLDALVASFGRDNWFMKFRTMRNGAFIDDGNGKKRSLLLIVWQPGPMKVVSMLWRRKVFILS